MTAHYRKVTAAINNSLDDCRIGLFYNDFSYILVVHQYKQRYRQERSVVAFGTKGRKR